MKTRLILATLLTGLLLTGEIRAQQSQYVPNREPLVGKPYLELPLGSIKPEGWLLEMLQRQRNGMTGHMDELYPLVMGQRNGWLGGDGDMWERGPYWIDGLLPLAYILDDEAMKRKVQPWIEWALASQKADGSFGPDKDYPAEKGLQRNRAEDWWPRMVVLKILKQYYSATGDGRVTDFMTKYFRYQLQTLPEKKLDHWSFWSLYRVCDNLQTVYWLYNITGDKFLLDLSEMLHRQAFDFTGKLLGDDFLCNKFSVHCVNLAQGIKEPVIYYQQSGDKKHLEAVKKGFADLRKFNGWPNGMYGGDESLHGADPTQGTELCSVVELMLSLEEIFQITGDGSYADYLEKVTFNALPTQISDDFMTRQYFQQANQIVCSRDKRNFTNDHNGNDNLFGLLTGYTCCTANLHQGWPKFVQNLWYATPDGGIAAMVYSPSSVTARVAGGTEVTVREETSYPFEERIVFTVTPSVKKGGPVKFPFSLRIPEWCKTPVVKVNGETVAVGKQQAVVKIDRAWKPGDKVELELPMRVTTSRWYEKSVAVERGPLVYALKIGEDWRRIEVAEEERGRMGDYYWEVHPTTDWNYGLLQTVLRNPEKAFEVTVDPEKARGSYPWNTENAPIEIKAQAKRIPFWSRYNGSTGPLPWGPVALPGVPAETVTLIPYGCTTLRICEFPVIATRSK